MERHTSSFSLLLVLLLQVALLPLGLNALITDETEAAEFMKELDTRYSYECNLEMTARWDYITDVMDPDKEAAANAASVRYMSFKGEAAVNCSEYAYDGFSDVDLYRRFRFLSKQGPGALEQDDLTEYKDTQARMETTYSTATVCDYYEPTRCDLELEPDIEAIMASSENWDELRSMWDQWRENTGKLMRDDFIRFVELSNQAAVLDGFDNTGTYWLNPYTVDAREASAYTGGQSLDQQQFRDMVDDVWLQVSEGLYKKLHAYVRLRLQEVYPGRIDPTGPIPAHILGNMWAQDWTNIARFVMPFPEMPSFDVTDSMVENGWDIDTMFVAAEDFFTSVGLYEMTQTFWDKSVINQTEWGKTIVCHASAEDFCLGPDGDDYRIKMCTEVNMADLVTVHHEMGHIEYFMAYKNQPHVFRESANPGFHEAIGDLIALSVSTPDHLEGVLGLTPTLAKTRQEDTRYTDDEMRDLNFLMKMALEKIAFLPFGYLIDKYRWGVFDGSISSEELNAGWWNLRESLQGVTPPGPARGEEFFDPGAKYHVPANVPYIRYFVSFIVQFQFHSRLCEAAGHTGPLHTCDIYSNTVAGDILRTAMQKGFSEPWPKVLSELGGSSDMDPQPIINYFDPLIQYLDTTLAEAGVCIGWGEDCILDSADEDSNSPSSTDGITDPTDFTTDFATDESQFTSDGVTDISTKPPSTTVDPRKDEELAKSKMQLMDANMTVLVQRATEIDWEYYTNVTDATEAASVAAWTQVSQIYGLWHKEVIQAFDYEEFESESLKRQFWLQSNLGTAALNEEELNQFNSIVGNMMTIYTSKICPANNQGCQLNTEGLDIDALETEMATSRSYDDLEYYWTEWRDVSGKEMKDDYVEYITLLNKAAKDNKFQDAGDMWVQPYAEEGYNSTDFKAEIDDLWEQTSGLYKKLHAYVLHKLKAFYPISKDEEFIPAHLLGNMWAQTWENVYDIVAPYPNVSIPDISSDLQKLENVTDMFQMAEEFFTGIGLYKMTDDFKKHTLYEKPGDRVVICHASAWDFFDIETNVITMPDDGRFRIKMCTDKNQEDFIVVHHEMGHTQYQMAYSFANEGEERPLIFRNGANPGFHEAIGDTIALSVTTPAHLDSISSSIGSESLRATDPDLEDKQNLNFLLKTALTKIAFLPYSYILDQWRWELFANDNSDLQFNRLWWEKRLDIQGIAPPVGRYPKTDFDPGSKYHVAANVPYIRYFVAYILQFQFHERLCDLANSTVEIFNCDIEGNTEAGDALMTMLHKGASESWQTQLGEFLDREGRMNAASLLEYFDPLRIFLDNYLADNNITVGWTMNRVDDYMKTEVEPIPPYVPIIVGVVLAVMVCIVLVAYIVGRNRQKKKAKEVAASGGTAGTSPETSNSPGEKVEMAPLDIEEVESGSGGPSGKAADDTSSDKDDKW